MPYILYLLPLYYLLWLTLFHLSLDSRQKVIKPILKASVFFSYHNSRFLCLNVFICLSYACDWHAFNKEQLTYLVLFFNHVVTCCTNGYKKTHTYIKKTYTCSSRRWPAVPSITSTRGAPRNHDIVTAVVFSVSWTVRPTIVYPIAGQLMWKPLGNISGLASVARRRS